MKSFEMPSNPEADNSSDFEIPANEPENPGEQESTITAEGAIEEEKSILDKFRGKARQVAKVMTLVSALSFGSGLANESRAEEPKAKKQTEQSAEQSAAEINDANVTASSRWSEALVKLANNDRSQLKSSEDAEALVTSYFNQFISEYYLPTQGELKEGSYGMKERIYSDDDLRLLLQNAKEMKKMLEELNTQFGMKAYENRSQQIDDVIAKLERQNSYAGKDEARALEQLNSMLK